MADFLRRSRREKSPDARVPKLSFGTWDDFPTAESKVVQVCHPDWRGVRTAAYAFRSPVVECDDLELWGEELSASIERSDIDTVVIQGWPPGASSFADRLNRYGVQVKCVLHSSPAQHGAEQGEADVVDEVLGLGTSGILAGVGMVKAGVHRAFEAIGYQVDYVPNRVPQIPELEKLDLGDGTHVGVFAEPFWRKNVTTQLLAIGLMEEATAHVLKMPNNGYLDALTIVEHRELPWTEFLGLQGSVDLNLYVTLSECYPLTPQESYLTGVPCLISRTSSVFKSDPILWELTTTDEPDNPEAITRAAKSLMARKDEAISRARAWMETADVEAAAAWSQFLVS